MADRGSPCDKTDLLMDTTTESPCTCLSTITPFKFLHLAHQFGVPGPDILLRLNLVVVRYDGGVCRGVGRGPGAGANVSEQSDSCCTRISVSSASPGFRTFCVARPHGPHSADICRCNAQV